MHTACKPLSQSNALQIAENYSYKVSISKVAFNALLCIVPGATAQVAAVTPLVAQAPSCTTIAALATKSGVLGVLVSAAQVRCM